MSKTSKNWFVVFSICQDLLFQKERYMDKVIEESKKNDVATPLIPPSNSRRVSRENSIDEGSFKAIRVISVPHLSKSDSFYRPNSSFSSYDTFINSDSARTIRFQVVIWYVGQPDEVLGRVEMKFRVTVFWNSLEGDDEEIGYGLHNTSNKMVWKMHGRQRAFQSELSEICDGGRVVYVPPVSILNAVDYEVQGEPEVCLLSRDDHLMKWTCLYKASLLQEDMHVENFPHDSHDLVLRLGILKHRQARKRWDKNRWKLGLASKDDAHDTIDISHGTIVDHVKVPGYVFDTNGLEFEFLPLDYGSNKLVNGRDQCLQVKFRVTRQSSYYDRNIIPLTALLNVVAVSVLALTPEEFGDRAESYLAAAFVQIGIRMTVDGRLPLVGYQIKIQWVLSNFFYGLLFLVLESCVAYILSEHNKREAALILDVCAAILETGHTITVLLVYSIGSGSFCDKFCFKWFKRRLRYA